MESSRMFRRILSILLYVIAGLFLIGEAMVAFVQAQPDTSKAAMLAFMAPFFLVPLALGALASPGARLRELGIVLMAAAAWLIPTILCFFYVAVRPDTRDLLPADTMEVFGDRVAGALNLAAIVAIGLALFFSSRLRSRSRG
jgi:hypothetical protein